MNRQLVSIIVPVYNAQDYLDECIESILKQTYKDYEIILVDDGSMDKSPRLCDEYANQYANIVTIHQNNQGVAQARENGVKKALGEWIVFIDADDTVDENFVLNFMNSIGESDLVTSGALREEANGLYTKRVDGINVGIYSSYDEIDYIIRNMLLMDGSIDDGILPYTVTKMFKKDLLLGVYSNLDLDIKIDEDRALVLCYILSCKSITITHNILYNYRYNMNSAMHSGRDDYLTQLNMFYIGIKNYFLKKSSYHLIEDSLEKFVNSRIYNATSFMRFQWKNNSFRYLCPYFEIIKGKKIVIYGAGKVGVDYFRLLTLYCPNNEVYWTDKDWQKKSCRGMNVQSIEGAVDWEYDYIIIALKSKEIAEIIKEDLSNRGFLMDRVLWQKPIDISEMTCIKL